MPCRPRLISEVEERTRLVREAAPLGVAGELRAAVGEGLQEACLWIAWAASIVPSSRVLALSAAAGKLDSYNQLRPIRRRSQDSVRNVGSRIS